MAPSSMTNTETLLSLEFLAKFPDFPTHMAPVGQFVFLRTYSRWLPHLKRRETYKEVCARASQYNVNLAIDHLKNMKYAIDWNLFRTEAELLFENMFNLKQCVSGRSLWIGGTSAAKKAVIANFNCAFINIERWLDFCDMFYALLVGTGCGFKSTKLMAAQMPKIRIGVTLLHSDYNPMPVEQRIEHSQVTQFPNGFVKIYIGDSKEGWVQALRYYFNILTDTQYDHVHTIKFNYNSIRPKGERLKTFGGQSSGMNCMKELFQGIDNVLKNKIDPELAPLVGDDKGYASVRPIHILDIGNLIGSIVVVGGVRRTSEIFLFDDDDYESMFAKYGINGFWTDEHLAHHRAVSKKLEAYGIKPKWFDSIDKIGQSRGNLNHRRMSNNSIAFTSKPSAELLEIIFDIMRSEGEPGFTNLEEARRRRPNCEGMNPCCEILLDSKGLCNLTTVNLVQFITHDENGDPELDYSSLIAAQKLSARCGVRMTLPTLELPEWDFVQRRDRLIGTSLTGIKDAMDILGYSREQERHLIQHLSTFARSAAHTYAISLRIPAPLLVTTIKPEGSLSMVFNGVSPGLHFSHSPYFIRRIRINASDPLAKAVKELGWVIHPEVGTPGSTEEERMNNANTLVIDFPIASGARRTKYDVSALEQLETYFMYQKTYTEHNSSNTISVRECEWQDVRNKIYENWDNFVGVSFLSLDNHTYQLAPYEECSEDAVKQLQARMKPLTIEFLTKFEQNYEEAKDFTMGKVAGACEKLEEDVNVRISNNESMEIPLDSSQTSDCVNGVCPLR